MFIDVLCKDLRHHAFQFDTVDELRKVHKLLVGSKKINISKDMLAVEKKEGDGVSKTVQSYKPFDECIRQGIFIKMGE